jgi:thiamine transport system substrate-binding protein
MSEYPSRKDPRKIIAAVVVISVIAVASYAIITWPQPKTDLIIYTYSSFLDWGDEGWRNVTEAAFAAFENQYNANVTIYLLQTDANGIVSRLNAEAASPVADIVIGIDNLLILQETARNVLEPYTPSNLNLIDESLVTALDPDHYVVPFDFGLVTLIYDIASINTTSNPELETLTFNDLATEELASTLVTEDPRHSSPGLAFLLTEITVQEKLVGADWKDWWTSVADEIDVQPGWTDAFNKFYDDPSINMVVSYGTDPAWTAYNYGIVPDTAVATIYHEGNHYAWTQIEGIGLVKNGPNPELAKAFIEYCLTSEVQSHIALNQWMFPANMHVTLDPAFDYAVSPNDVEVLNNLIDRSEIASNLTDWLDEWENIMVS